MNAPPASAPTPASRHSSASKPKEPPRIAVIVKGYPRLSETFITQEILGLEQRGLPLEIVSLRHPYDRAVHALHDQIRADVRYLPEYLYQEATRVRLAWQKVRHWPSYAAARRLWQRDLYRDRSANRGRRFGQALVLAAELPASIQLLYVHYLHTPASVARYAAVLTGLPFCISAHAKDIWTSPDWEKREKIEDCRWLTTCTEANRAHLAALAPEAKVMLTYHGLDRQRFAPAERRLGPNGLDPAMPVRLLGVARLVPKKGIDVLLKALASLPEDLHWRYDHIGGGDGGKALKAQATALGLDDRVRWQGSASQDDVLLAYRKADLFVLASRIAEDGDRDGLPNVLMEAGSQALAVIATKVSAVPELIEDGRTGALVPPDDPTSLAAALARLIRQPERRLQHGEALQHTVFERFQMAPNLDHLAERLKTALPLSTSKDAA